MDNREKIDWEEVLSSAAELPSLPGVAVQILKMANDPDTEVAAAVSVLSKDPAIAGRLLRAVNSCIYVKPREVESLKQAVVIMGMDSALSLALSFSLVNTFQQPEKSGLNYELYWRRALLCALAARVIASSVGEKAVEEVFLAALLQDIGMLVLDRVKPEFYSGLGWQQACHDSVLKYESDRLYLDHAAIGGHLLRIWQLPERLADTVYCSHDADVPSSSGNIQQFVSCVTLSSAVSDLFLGEDKFDQYHGLVLEAGTLLRLGEYQVQHIIEELARLIPDMESLFSVRLVSADDVAAILEQAATLREQRAAPA